LPGFAVAVAVAERLAVMSWLDHSLLSSDMPDQSRSAGMLGMRSENLTTYQCTGHGIHGCIWAGA